MRQFNRKPFLKRCLTTVIFCVVPGGVLLSVFIFSPLSRPDPAFAEDTAAVGAKIVQGDPADDDLEIQVPPPPLSDYFPCSQCHADLETDPRRRVLEMEHTDIVLEHDEEHRWCLDCHNPDDRDYLRLASGKLVEFTESYRLCGQCHGTKYRDWKAGVHGKRTGSWNGKKQYLLCVHCHYPHSPRFKPVKPEPPPVRPEDLR